MIKILKHGKMYRKTLECPNCECVFEYSEEDEFEFNDKINVKCPECAYLIKLRDFNPKEDEDDENIL